MKSFIKFDRPLLCCMIQDRTPQEMIATIANGLQGGAEAFGIQLESLRREYRDEQTIREIFAACQDKPIYFTSYRGGESKGMTDEQCVELLLLGAQCGGTLADIMGDLYCRTRGSEMTTDPTAIARQKELIRQLHQMGCEVLMSAHFAAYYDESAVIGFAKEQQSRGADVVKMVNHANDEDQQLESLGVCTRLKRSISAKYLYLVGGTHCRMLRFVGERLGNCMTLCVDRHHPYSAKQQPTLRAAKAVRDNMIL